MKKLWQPIANLKDKYANNLLLCAPELIDLDCNEAGIAPGYWQDDRDAQCDVNGAIREPGVDYGGFVGAKWSMTNDEWYECSCAPTHFIVMEGPIAQFEAGPDECDTGEALTKAIEATLQEDKQ